jgi:zinc transporter ZupT
VREREPEAPPRFAQLVGLLFAVVGAAGYLLGVPLLGAVATGFALVAALLNAATGFCLGCELYLSLRRVLPRTA